MKRPEECLEEARLILANRDAAHPSLLAEGDQWDAQAKATLAEMAERADFPHHDRVEGERPLAFLIAAETALFERLSERPPSEGMCPHMTDLRIPHMVNLEKGYVACLDCAPVAERLSAWSDDRCDVCGLPAPGNLFTYASFTMGAAVAYANICDPCRSFLGLREQES